MHRQERRSFDRGDAVPDHLLHLLKGTYLDLPYALARDAELSGELLENDRLVGKPPRLEDAPFPLIEYRECFAQRLPAVVRLFALGKPRLLVRDFIDQRILPFSLIAFVTDRRIERHIAAKPAVHVDNVPLSHAEASGNKLHLVGLQIALLQCRELALRLA